MLSLGKTRWHTIRAVRGGSPEIRRHALDGTTTVTALAPLPKRTPHHPLFDVSGVDERSNDDLRGRCGEYLVVVPMRGNPRRLDLRSVFGRRTESAGRLLHVRAPEGTSGHAPVAGTGTTGRGSRPHAGAAVSRSGSRDRA